MFPDVSQDPPVEEDEGHHGDEIRPHEDGHGEHLDVVGGSQVVEWASRQVALCNNTIDTLELFNKL